jgi:DNA-binding NarL/FixJ family response regulator
MKPIRVLLADDHGLVRAGIRSLIEQFKDMVVVAEANDGREGLELIRVHNPDVVLMDIAMKGLNGIDAAAQISRNFPGIRVVILSMYANEEYVAQALQAGANGYIMKDAATFELELALRAVMRGEMYLSPAVSSTLVTDYLRRLKTLGATSSKEANNIALTLRQREILQLIAESKSNKEIARILGLSLNTIDNHRTQLMTRLNIHDVAGLVRYAIAIGLTPHNNGLT